MSQAAQMEWVQNGNSINEAGDAAELLLGNQLSSAGSLDSIIRDHSYLSGYEFRQKYGDKTLISFTEDLAQTYRFGTAAVFRAPYSQVRYVAIPGSPEEKEWLIPFMVKAERIQ